MALADIKGLDALDFLAEVIDPLTEIASDEKAMKMFRGGSCPKGMSREVYAAKLMQQSLPALLKNHKKSVMELLAACKQTPYSDYVKNADITTILEDATEVLNDEVIRDFLSSQAAATSGTASSGTATESSEEAASAPSADSSSQKSDGKPASDSSKTT